jgi:hypothetical protein
MKILWFFDEVDCVLIIVCIVIFSILSGLLEARYSKYDLHREMSGMQGIVLALPTHELATKGCNSAIIINPETQLNSYFTAPFYRPDIISRSSSTTSFATEGAFAHAEQVRQKLLKAHCHGNLESYSNHVTTMRDRLALLLQLSACSQEIYSMFTPSGTDAELFISLMALLRHHDWKRGLRRSKCLVTNIILADGEIGSRSLAAGSGYHFNDVIPSDECVHVGTMIKEFDAQLINMVSIPARDYKTGSVLAYDYLEKKIEQILIDAVSDDQIVVLHLVHYSKTGIETPRFSFVQRMKKQYGRSLIVVVDAAQTRFKRSMIHTYLDNNFFVIVTGSKFYGAPSFCGAVMMPQSEVSQFLSAESPSYVPEGFTQFFTQDDCDARLYGLRKSLGLWKNYGMVMRWEMALFEMEKIYSLSHNERAFICQQWVIGLKKLIATIENIEAFEEKNSIRDLSGEKSLFGDISTIVPVRLHNPFTKKYFDGNSLKYIHGLMMQDLSLYLPDNATDEERTSVAKKYLIGQPVIIASGRNGFGVLRIALSAPMVYEMSLEPHDGSRIKKMLEQDRNILVKLSLIVRYFEELKGRK